MMRTGSCHRLSIPCMSPMARNKLVTALPATLSGYLWGTGLCQLPLLPHSCAFVYMCVCVCGHKTCMRERGAWRLGPWLRSVSPFARPRTESWYERTLHLCLALALMKGSPPSAGEVQGGSYPCLGSWLVPAAPFIKVRFTVSATVTAAQRVNPLRLCTRAALRQQLEGVPAFV